jgi:hypothetical protein
MILRVGTHATGVIITAADDPPTTRIDTPHTLRVSFENLQAEPTLDVPYSQCGVTRSSHSDGVIVQCAQRTNGSGVSRKGVYALPERNKGEIRDRKKRYQMKQTQIWRPIL